MVSGVNTGRITKQVSKMYKFNHYQYSVVIGILLLDATIVYSKGGQNPRLGFKQSLNKSYYVFEVFTILSPFCKTLPKLFTAKRN